jgi:DnaJ like chaperone protein
MLGGPLGAILGAALGHHFDRGLKGLAAEDRAGFRVGDQARVQSAFFTATFSVMGHIAKADGRVSEDEIDLARTVMAHMQLPPDMKRTAIRLFNEGKQADFPLEDVLQQFRRECHRRVNLLRMFVEIQIQAAYADGAMHPAERRVLEHVCRMLGIALDEFAHLEAFIRAQRHAHRGGAAQPHPTLKDAYDVLGIDKSVSDDEVKKAYRRLMSQHHPDKLVARGLPEEMMELAKEKTQEIRAAYDEIKKSRGMR